MRWESEERERHGEKHQEEVQKLQLVRSNIHVSTLYLHIPLASFPWGLRVTP